MSIVVEQALSDCSRQCIMSVVYDQMKLSNAWPIKILLQAIEQEVVVVYSC